MATLKWTLEAVACLGDEYVVNESGYEWAAKELLQWLDKEYPDLLRLQVHLLQPTLGREGAIYEVNQDGEIVGGMPLYQIQRRPAPIQVSQRVRQADEQPYSESGSYI